MDLNTVNPAPEIPNNGIDHILKFYDSSIPESQYYPWRNILGYERGSGKFSIYFKGAKDVNAKDKVEITVTGSTISIDDAIELMINAPLYNTIHRDTTAIVEVVSDTIGKSIRSEFSQARITYGTCCSGGGGGGGTTYQAGDGIQIDTGTDPDTIQTDLKVNGGVVIQSGELALDLGASSITGTLAVADGGTGNTVIPNKSVIIGQTSGTDKMSGLQLSTNGQLIIGGSSGPQAARLTAGTGVSITNADGAITIARSSSVEFASFTVSGGDNGKSTPNGAYLIPNRDGKAFYEVLSVSSISFANATAQGINFNIAHRDLQLESFVGGVVTSSTPTEECSTHMKFVLLTDTLATGQTAFNFSVTVLATFAITAANQLQTFEASGLSINIPLKTAYAFAFVPDCSRIETWADIKGWANLSCVG